MSNVSVTLGLKNAGFNRGLDEARGKVRAFKKDVESGGGLFGSITGKLGTLFAAGAIFTGTKAIVDSAGAIRDQADAVGMSAEAMQRLQGAFADSGANAEKVTTSMQVLSQQMSDAMAGGDKSREAFERLGVSMDDLVTAANDPQEIIFKMADGFKNAADRGQALSDIQDLLGKGGKRMAAGMAAGGAELRKAFEEATVAGDAAINRLDAIGDWFANKSREGKAMAMGTLAGLTGAGQWRTLDGSDPEAGTKQMEAEAAAKRRAEKLDNDREIAARIAREKDAARILTQEQKLQDTIRGTAASASSRTRTAEIRRRIAELAPLAIGGGPDAAERRAEMAGLMSDRLAELKARNLMTPNERREADRQARRDSRAAARALRQLGREMPGDIRRAAEGTNKDLAAEAVNKGNEILKSVNDRLELLNNKLSLPR